MKNYIQFLIAILILTISSNCLAGGGWPQPKGKAYIKLSEWWIKADRHYTDMGLTDPNVTTGLYNTNFYAEYGFTDKLTVILNMPLLSRNVMNNQISQTNGSLISQGDALNTLGDTQLALKYGIINYGAIALSGSVVLGLPLGESTGGINGNLQTGDGEFNQMLRVDAGIPLPTLGSVSFYGNVYGAFNNRNKGFSDEYRYGAELGAGFLSQKLWLTGRFDVAQSRKNEDDGPIEGSFFANNSEFKSVTTEVSYLFTDKVGVSASYATAISGRIIFAAPSYSLGVFVKV